MQNEMSMEIFSEDFLNWLQRELPALYQHLSGLFSRESQAHERIIRRGPIDPTDLYLVSVFLEDQNIIRECHREQVFLFQRYSPEYLSDLRILHGISNTNIWHRNGGDQ